MKFLLSYLILIIRTKLCTYICSGWGLTENAELPYILHSVNLKVSAETPPDFLEALGGEEGYGDCMVI